MGYTEGNAASRAAVGFVSAVMGRVAAFEVKRATRPGGGMIGKATARPGRYLTVVKSGIARDDGRVDTVTAPGYLTERRRAPDILKRLGDDHQWTIAARLYASLSEKEGAISGVDLAGAGSGGGISDGGAASKTDAAWHLSALRLLIGDAVVLKPVPWADYPTALKFDQLTTRQVVDGLLLEGRSISHLIEGTARSANNKTVRNLVVQALMGALDRISQRSRL